MSFSLRLEDGLAVLALDRPPVNALDLATLAGLEQAFQDLAVRRPRGLVLTGSGRAFSAGVDTRAFAGGSPDDRGAMIRTITRMLAALYALPFPTVAAVNGHALGGGFVLMLACDLRFAAQEPEIRLGMTEAKAGVPFPAGALEVIRAELSPELLRRMTLSSEVMGVEALAARGVIDRLTPAGALHDEARAAAAALADQPAFAAVKQQLRAETVARLRALAQSGEDPMVAAVGGI